MAVPLPQTVAPAAAWADVYRLPRIALKDPGGVCDVMPSSAQFFQLRVPATVAQSEASRVFPLASTPPPDVDP